MHSTVVFYFGKKPHCTNWPCPCFSGPILCLALCDVAGANSDSKTHFGSCCYSPHTFAKHNFWPPNSFKLFNHLRHTHLMQGRAKGEGRDNIGPRPALLMRSLPPLPPPHLLSHLSCSDTTSTSSRHPLPIAGLLEAQLLPV